MRAFSFFAILRVVVAASSVSRALAILRAAGRKSRPQSYLLARPRGPRASLLRSGEAASWYIAPSIALFCGLSVIVVFDIEYLIIPDGPLLFLFVTGVVTTLLDAPSALWSRLVCAFAAWASLSLFAAAYERWRGFPGLGMADPKLFAIAGLWLGCQALPGCLLVAALSGLLSAAILMRERRLTKVRSAHAFRATPRPRPLARLDIWSTRGRMKA